MSLLNVSSDLSYSDSSLSSTDKNGKHHHRRHSFPRFDRVDQIFHESATKESPPRNKPNPRGKNLPPGRQENIPQPKEGKENKARALPVVSTKKTAGVKEWKIEPAFPHESRSGEYQEEEFRQEVCVPGDVEDKSYPEKISCDESCLDERCSSLLTDYSIYPTEKEIENKTPKKDNPKVRTKNKNSAEGSSVVEGPMGPPGPIGPRGPMGPPGECKCGPVMGSIRFVKENIDITLKDNIIILEGNKSLTINLPSLPKKDKANGTSEKTQEVIIRGLGNTTHRVVPSGGATINGSVKSTIIFGASPLRFYSCPSKNTWYTM